jgi:hypothetical protein
MTKYSYSNSYGRIALLQWRRRAGTAAVANYITLTVTVTVTVTGT